MGKVTLPIRAVPGRQSKKKPRGRRVDLSGLVLDDIVLAFNSWIPEPESNPPCASPKTQGLSVGLKP